MLKTCRVESIGICSALMLDSNQNVYHPPHSQHRSESWETCQSWDWVCKTVLKKQRVFSCSFSYDYVGMLYSLLVLFCFFYPQISLTPRIVYSHGVFTVRGNGRWVSLVCRLSRYWKLKWEGEWRWGGRWGVEDGTSVSFTRVKILQSLKGLL